MLENYVSDWFGFDEANRIMNKFILPYLNDFEEDDYFEYAQIRKLNDQIYGRDRDSDDNHNLISKMKEKGFDYHKFEEQLEI